MNPCVQPVSASTRLRRLQFAVRAGQAPGNRPYSFLLIVLFYAVGANIPFWFACPLLGLALDGKFCLDLCLIGILALFLPRFAASAGLLFVIVLDLVTAVSQTFGVPLLQCLANLSAFSSFAPSRLARAALVVLIAGITVWTGALIPANRLPLREKVKAASCLILFATTSLAIDYTTTVRRVGHIVNPVRHGFHDVGDVISPGYFDAFRPSRLASVRLMRSEINYLNTRAKSTQHPRPVRNAVGLAEQLIQTTSGRRPKNPPNLVLVLVESWGIHEDPAVNQALVAPFQGLQASGQYRIVAGTIPFFGFTVAGEGRELCGSEIGYQLEDASAAQLSGCLVQQMNALGYRTIALHGMDGRMFDRAQWYRTMGFQETHFRADFERQGLPNCVGAFVGTCDADIARWIGTSLAEDRDRPSFVYWVTLNSHLPVLVPSPLHQETLCAAEPSLAREPSLCSWHQLVLNVNRSLAQTAARARRPTIFVIVGDHAPPFLNARTRTEFSSAVVPYVMLVPREFVEAENRPQGPIMAVPQ